MRQFPIGITKYPIKIGESLYSYIFQWLCHSSELRDSIPWYSIQHGELMRFNTVDSVEWRKKNPHVFVLINKNDEQMTVTPLLTTDVIWFIELHSLAHLAFVHININKYDWNEKYSLALFEQLKRYIGRLIWKNRKTFAYKINFWLPRKSLPLFNNSKRGFEWVNDFCTISLSNEKLWKLNSRNKLQSQLYIFELTIFCIFKLRIWQTSSFQKYHQLVYPATRCWGVLYSSHLPVC